MTVPIILAIIGGIALLIGLFGGGVKAKEIEIPKIPGWPRLFSAGVGVILLGISVWLYSSPPPAVVATLTPPATSPELNINTPMWTATQPVPDTPTTEPLLPTETPIPLEVSFEASETSINAGKCTVLEWVVKNAAHVYLEGIEAGGMGDEEVCPSSTTTYTLTVEYEGGTTSRDITINVIAAPAITGDAIVVLHNNTQTTIAHVYFGCEQWGGWSGEQLSNPIPPGGTHTWEALSPGAGIYDLRAEDSGQNVLDQKTGVTINGTYDWLVGNGSSAPVNEKPVVIMHNNTQTTIAHVYFGCGSGDSWSGEQLSGSVPPGGSHTWELRLGCISVYSLKAEDGNHNPLDIQINVTIAGNYDWYVGGEP